MQYSGSYTEGHKGAVKRRAKVLKWGLLGALGLLGVVAVILVVVGLTAQGPGE